MNNANMTLELLDDMIILLNYVAKGHIAYSLHFNFEMFVHIGSYQWSIYVGIDAYISLSIYLYIYIYIYIALSLSLSLSIYIYIYIYIYEYYSVHLNRSRE